MSDPNLYLTALCATYAALFLVTARKIRAARGAARRYRADGRAAAQMAIRRAEDARLFAQEAHAWLDRAQRIAEGVAETAITTGNSADRAARALAQLRAAITAPVEPPAPEVADVLPFVPRGLPPESAALHVFDPTHTREGTD